MRIKLDKDAEISLDMSKDKKKVLFSTKVSGQNGKMFLTTLELNKDNLDEVIFELVTLRSNLLKNEK